MLVAARSLDGGQENDRVEILRLLVQQGAGERLRPCQVVLVVCHLRFAEEGFRAPGILP